MYRSVALMMLLLFGSFSAAHEGPDPVMRWRADAESIVLGEQSTTLKARLGPNATVIGESQFMDDEAGGSLFLPGKTSGISVVENIATLENPLPKTALTISVWCTVDSQLRWGGLLGAFQDNGAEEDGWVLGYNNDVFTFGLASKDGPGRMTYLAGKTKYELGRIYHVVGVYDGKTMQLYVNGKLDAESNEQSGDIRYPAKAPMTLAAYRDADEFYGHRGRLREAAVYSMAAKANWAEHEFSHHAALSKKPAVPVYEPLAFEIDPYLQFGTQESMTVMWKTNRPATTIVRYGETSECKLQATGAEDAIVHELKLSDLKPQTQYFYRVESNTADADAAIVSEVATFQTAVLEETPFAFAVISDTQGNPTVSGQLAEFAWGQRPSFLLHPGDLVSTGPVDQQWTGQFFPSMNPLIRHVPFFPVLGNHEQNAKNYFDYVSLPKPEFHYTFKFGNTQFFMIDSNRNVDPKSQQYSWLDDQLQQSGATWKIVCHHHPPYSSDENDYGNLWKTNKGSRGDTRVRQLVPLYEKHGVDVVWNGHIHSYERTWPIRSGRAVQQGAPIYMITGGGGGHLETPGPIRPFFQNTVRRGHHYAMVRVNGKRIEIQVYDLENRLFDQLNLAK